MSVQGFSIPREERYFEDYIPGTVYEFAETVTVSEAEILKFAKEFDPQYFHIDLDQALAGPFKGLIASGAHTIALTFGLYVRTFLPDKASFGSPGLDELRWLKPVRPNDVLRLRVTIEEVIPSKSKNNLGTVCSLLETINQKDEVVLSHKAKGLIGRRKPA
ncbi:MAG: MaoC family dehydratase [Deltaproteobacteria bacterium]|jgi:acyl dehydratase|nr:MaoC family dehydratase [Deltaproteobacteria bacterium]